MTTDFNLRSLKETLDRISSANGPTSSTQGAPTNGGVPNGLASADTWDFYTAMRPQGARQPETQDEHGRPVPTGISLRMFDDKIATYDEYRYNGTKGGDKWRLKVRGYWLSKCPQLLPLLNAVERSEVPITKGVLESITSAAGGSAMSDSSDRELATLSALLYGFLNTATYGDADDIMVSIPELHGFEAWRALCRHIDSGRTLRQDALRRKMRRPVPIKSLADVPQGVLRFNNLYRDFREAGGEEMTKDTLKSDLYETLPSALRDQLLWHTIDPNMSWDAFREHVAATATRILHYSHQSPVHLADESRVNALIAELKALGVEPQADVLAMSGAKRMCANCGKQHAGPCKAARVPAEQRTCWGCGKAGHNRAQCPEGNTGGGGARPTGRPVKSVESQDTNVSWFGCVSYAAMAKQSAVAERARPDDKWAVPQHDEGWVVARGRDGRRCQKPTLGDFIVPNTMNRFKQLTETTETVATIATTTTQKVPQRGAESLSRSKSNEPIINTCAKGVIAVTERPLDTATATAAPPFTMADFPILRSNSREQVPTDVDMKGLHDDKDDSDFQDIMMQMAKHDGGSNSNDEDLEPKDDDGDALGMWDVRETPNRPGNLHKVDPMVNVVHRPQHSCCGVRGGLVLPADEAVPAETPLVNRWRVPSIPSELGPRHSNDSGIFVSVDYAEANINGADEEREIEMALDSGAVDHVICTDLLPSATEIGEVTGARVGKSFIAANGQPMKTFGECILECADDQGKSAASFAVTEVSRALQSVSRMCDQGLEVLFTRTEAKVRDPKTGKFVARYARRGGLYTRTVRVRPGSKPVAPTPGNDKNGRKAQPFTRQGRKP